MADEIWKSIPGWDYYEVSDLGRVRSLDKVVKSKGGFRTIKGRERKPNLVKGYYRITLRDRNRTLDILVHRLVLTVFDRLPLEGEETRHRNGISTDNRLENLVWGTRPENRQDIIAHGNDRNKTKTHCPQNHPYEGDNLYIDPTGGRHCRICRGVQWPSLDKYRNNKGDPK